MEKRSYQRKIMKTTVYLTLTLLSLWMPQGLFAAAPDLTNLLQKGLVEEEGNQNLEAAIKNYQALIQGAEEQRKLVATAVFRLGECYRKQGRTNEAAAQYQRIVSEYAEQSTLVNLSKQNLVGLGMTAPRVDLAGKLAPSMPGATEVKSRSNPPQSPGAIGLEETEIEEVQRLLKDSPDLINRNVWSVNAPNSMEPRLHVSARQGRFKVAEFLLANGVDINSRAANGATALHVATEAGNKTMVEFLIDHGADVNARYNRGQTPLHLAASLGLKAVAEVLLAHKALINAVTDVNPSFGSMGGIQEVGLVTPLHLAAQKGNTATIELLLNKGADVGVKDGKGRQALHVVASSGLTPAAELLLAHKADVNARDDAGATPLYLSIDSNRSDMIELLLKHQADINAAERSSLTPLHRAVSSGNVPAVEVLLKYKADVNARTQNKETPLYLVCNANGAAREQLLKIADLLLKNGADPNLMTGNGSYAPLHIIASRGDEAMTKTLLAYKPNLEVTNYNGLTPLHFAVERRSGGVAKMLLEAGANVNAVDVGGDSPLFMALRSPNNMSPERNFDTELIALLLAHKANVNTRNRSGQTPVQFIKDTGYHVNKDEVVLMLKNAGYSEALERIGSIEVSREGKRIYIAFSRNPTNEMNQHTLLEVLARIYCQGDEPPVYARSGPPTGGKTARPVHWAPQYAPLVNGSSFPDFGHIRVTHWDKATGKSKETTVDVEQILASGDPAQDVRVEWGDAVEIPVLDHGVSEVWQGLSETQARGFYDCLKREVAISIKSVKGEPVPVTLVPFLEFTERKPMELNPPNKHIAAYRLKQVLDLSGLLRVSSDMSRVTVKRNQPESKEQVAYVLDLTNLYDPSNDLWLRNGDVIEVPEK